MLDNITRRIDDYRDILVGKLPDTASARFQSRSYNIT